MGVNREQVMRALQSFFGYSGFRPGQGELVERVMQKRNALGILPTGGGKSITYQLPSLLFPFLTIVVTPLISLMIDQVQQLRQKGRRDVAYVNSSLSAMEMRETLREIREGRYRLVYISPEKLQQPAILQLLGRRKVSLVAIDEAHCISQWGHDFRTDYLRLPDVVEMLGSPPVLALTATATAAVREEICRLFRIEQEDVVVQPLNRSNIAYDIKPVASEAEKLQEMVGMLRQLAGQGIVYCATRQAVERLVTACKQAGLESVHGYHGGMSAMERVQLQEQFLLHQLDVMIATNAFGMGIDKPDIRFVLHYHFPASIEAYVQEVGRIGRDGERGYACLFYLPEDALIHQHLVQNECPTEAEVGWFLQQLQQIRPDGPEKLVQLSQSELQTAFGGSENLSRALLFYAERSGLIGQLAQTREGYQFALADGDWTRAQSRISRQFQRTAGQKRQKLQEITAWIEGTACLRTGLSAYFGEQEASSSVENCCCRCGLNPGEFFTDGKKPQKAEQEAWDLTRALRRLLPELECGREASS
jgi:ATP-dependent DNA helicase RecQ